MDKKEIKEIKSDRIIAYLIMVILLLSFFLIISGMFSVIFSN